MREKDAQLSSFKSILEAKNSDIEKSQNEINALSTLNANRTAELEGLKSQLADTLERLASAQQGADELSQVRE